MRIVRNRAEAQGTIDPQLDWTESNVFLDQTLYTTTVEASSSGSPVPVTPSSTPTRILVVVDYIPNFGGIAQVQNNTLIQDSFPPRSEGCSRDGICPPRPRRRPHWRYDHQDVPKDNARDARPRARACLSGEQVCATGHLRRFLTGYRRLWRAAQRKLDRQGDPK
jgi:hypothetical protein